MPKKKTEISPKEQSRRFLDAAQKLVDAGELDPTEAEDKLTKALKILGTRDGPKSNDRR